MTRTGLAGERTTVATSIGDVAVWTRGSGPTLVLLHGIVANADLWGETLQHLAEDHRCISIDLPLGAHDLPAKEGSDLTPAALSDVVAEVIGQVTDEPPIVVANDTGGAIAQFLAVRHPETIGGLVLTSCDTFRNFLPLSLRYLQGLARMPGGVWLMVQTLRVPFLRRLPIAFGWLTKRPLSDALYSSFLSSSRTSPGVRRDLGSVLRGISARALDANSAGLAEFERPVLLAWADTNRVFPLEQGRRMEKLMPQARLVPIADARAFVPVDAPEVLAGLVRDFVAAMPPSPTPHPQEKP
jgi:pimeloyl-ACP methyl ester carboxylesterase